jgi:hypothetical protein
MKPQWQRKLERREWLDSTTANGRVIRTYAHDTRPHHKMPKKVTL